MDQEPAAPFLADLVRVSLAGESSFLVYNSAACPLRGGPCPRKRLQTFCAQFVAPASCGSTFLDAWKKEPLARLPAGFAAATLRSSRRMLRTCTLMENAP